MSGMLRSVTTWLTTSGIKVLGILVALIILSQMSKWIVKWLEMKKGLKSYFHTVF